MAGTSNTRSLCHMQSLQATLLPLKKHDLKTMQSYARWRLPFSFAEVLSPHVPNHRAVCSASPNLVGSSSPFTPVRHHGLTKDHAIFLFPFRSPASGNQGRAPIYTRARASKYCSRGCRFGAFENAPFRFNALDRRKAGKKQGNWLANENDKVAMRNYSTSLKHTGHENASLARKSSTSGHDTSESGMAGYSRAKRELSLGQEGTPAMAQRHLMNRLPHMPHIQRPTKEELLAAANGFWSRLKIRFKWFSIRSARPFNADEIGAFFSWVLFGHVLWIFLGTTTFFSLAILAVNTVFAQGKVTLR